MLPKPEGAYGILARFYDELMLEALDYSQWFAALRHLLAKEGKPLSPHHRVLDLACGTGLMTEQMAQAGYQVIGADLSEEMLAVAEQRLRRAGHSVPLLRADMRDFDLGITFDCVFCLCDSLNYIEDSTQLPEVFASVARALKPNGVFVFDVNSEYKLSQIYGSNTYAEIRDGWSYIWENTYDPEQGICQMDLAFYIQDPDGNFTQYRERHYKSPWTMKR